MFGFLFGVAVAVAAMLALGHVLRADDGAASADAIVALSGDAEGARVRAAVALYQAGHAPLIIFSGGSVDPASVPSAEIMRMQAISAGVPPEAIVVEGQSRTTYENALLVCPWMQGQQLRTALLVTSPYHQRRAALEFSRAVACQGIAFRNVPADDPAWDPTFWWLERRSRDLTLVELAKLSVALVSR